RPNLICTGFKPAMVLTRKKYLLGAVSLFFVEVFIAVFVHDRFVRPFGGDFLVVIFLYCLLRVFWSGPVWKAALAVLLFAYLIEILQYFKLVNLLHVQHSKVATVVIGTAFEWSDMLAYTLGILLVLVLEKATKA
ncbi:MAG: DUF2809 domain-containing protein, partial [Saprospiraceae bacterium]